MNISEPIVTALEFVSETGVFQAEQMKGRRIQIVNMHGVSHDVVTEIVGLTMHMSLPDTCTGDPDTEAAGMMVAPVVAARQDALRVHGTPEFAAPDDQRILE